LALDVVSRRPVSLYLSSFFLSLYGAMPIPLRLFSPPSYLAGLSESVHFEGIIVCYVLVVLGKQEMTGLHSMQSINEQC
jgi:hypothetical protein